MMWFFWDFDIGIIVDMLGNVSAATVFIVFRQAEPLQVSKRFLL